MLYTAVVTRIVGSQQETVEVPCPNISTFSKTTDFFNKVVQDAWGAKPFELVINHCPYGMICLAERKRKGVATGEYVFATLHRAVA